MGATDVPMAPAQRLIPRSKSFHQVFKELQQYGGPTQEQAVGHKSALPALLARAYQRAYATRDPDQDDNGPAGSASGADDAPDKAPGGDGKGRFRAAAMRSMQQRQEARDAPQSKRERGEVADGTTGADADPAGVEEEPEDEAALEEDEAVPQEVQEAMDEFSDVAGDGGGSGRKGGLMAQLKAVYDKGGQVNNDPDAQDEGPDGSAELKKQLQERVDANKDKAQEALDSLKRFQKDQGGDGPLANLFKSAKEAVAEKLGEAVSAAADKLPGARKKRLGVKSRQQAAYKPHPAVLGPEPWLPCGLSPEEVALRAQVRELVVAHVLPNAAKWDKNQTLPRRFMAAAGRAGLCAMLTDKVAGGAGLSHVAAAAAMEALGGGDLSAAALVAHQNVVSWLMGRHAPLLLRLTMTRLLASGLAVGTLASSEPLAHRSLAATLTFAVMYKDQTGTYWILNGIKDYVPLGPSAELVLVVARTSPDPKGGLTFFLLPKCYPGMFFLKRRVAVGCRTLCFSTLVMAGCIVRDELTVGKEAALQAITQAMSPYRLLLASAAVGSAQVGLSMAWEWLSSRRHFTGPLLASYQALQHRLVRLQARVEGARLVAQGAAHAMDCKDRGAPARCALAKLHCVRCAGEVLDACMELFGAAGCHATQPLARMRRDLAVYAELGGDEEACVEVAWRGEVGKRRTRVIKGAQQRQASGQGAGQGGSEGEEDEEADEEDEEEDEDDFDDGGDEDGDA